MRPARTTPITVLALAAIVMVGHGGVGAAAGTDAEEDRIAFVRYTDANVIEEVFSVQPGKPAATQLTFSAAISDIQPAWSPEGTRIAFHRLNQIWIINADGGDLVPVPNTVGGFSPSWSPDGGRLAFSRNDGNDDEVYVVRTDGTGLAQITDNRQDDREPAWSPDGKRIAFVRYNLAENAAIVVRHLGSGAERWVTPLGYDAGPDWSPDGKRIAFSRFLPGQGNFIFTVKRNGAGLTQRTFPVDWIEQNDTQPVWSPTGDRIAFGRTVNEASPGHIVVLVTKTGALHQVTSGADVHDDFPSW